MLNFRTTYTIISMILISIDLYIAVNSYRKKSREGNYLCQAGILAAIVAFTYLISVLEYDYFMASLFSSLYFLTIDWLLVTMIKLSTAITTRGREWRRRNLMYALELYAIFDSIVFLINPFREIAISYKRRNTVLAVYAYQMKPLYYMHLAFTYLMVIGVMGILVYKMIRAPRRYRDQYSYIVATIMCIVAVNAIFLIPGAGNAIKVLDILDTSIIGYTIGLMVIYWSCFKYRGIYLKHGLSNMVLDTMNQGVVLFDYDGFLVMKNEKADRMLPFIASYDPLKGDLRVENFVSLCGISAEKHDIGNFYSLQLFSDTSPFPNLGESPEERKIIHDNLPRNQGSQLRCDYRRLDNADQDQIGELFVFTMVSEETDLLTGYHSWRFFTEFVHRDSYSFCHPCAIAHFDINNLSRYNREMGQEAGDAQIRRLAEIIRKCMPDETYFVRGHDAHLIAIAYFTDAAQMKARGDQVIKQFRGRLEVGYSVSETEETDVLALIQEAGRSMEIKKLMDGDSLRFHTISSLVRALKESDSDTEAHVQRTQKMGYELGNRFGLSDLEQSQLSLLCLLHDIGKVGVPLEILNKPGRLTNEEWAVLKTHPEKGYQIASSSFELRDIADMILYHHERWDGKGYPKGLAGEEIPFLARIISVIDAYDAMVSNRVYRKGMPPEKAREELIRCSGTQFDPEIVNQFLKMYEETPEIFEEEEGRDSATVTETMGSHSDELYDEIYVPGSAKDLISSSARELVASSVSDLRDISSQKAPLYQLQSHPIDFSKYEMNLDDYILSADEHFESVTGYSSEDIEEGRLRQKNLIPEEDREEYFKEVDKQLEKGNEVYIEHNLLRKDGKRIYVFCYARKFYHSASKSMRVEVVVVDVARTIMFRSSAQEKSSSSPEA